jgi:hypothetical protein
LPADERRVVGGFAKTGIVRGRQAAAKEILHSHAADEGPVQGSVGVMQASVPTRVSDRR